MNDNLFFSRYTYLFVSSKGRYLIYNSRTNSFLEVDGNLYNQLLECKKKQSKITILDSEFVSLLWKRKMIVSEGEDDNFLLELQYETDRSSYSKYILGLSVVPTLACNFSCHYSNEIII